MVRYFAYGANVNKDFLLNKYNVSILSTNVGIMLGYTMYLTFSNVLNATISSIRRSKYDIVYGIIYDFDKSMIEKLDIQEHVSDGVYKLIGCPVYNMDKACLEVVNVYISDLPPILNIPNNNLYKSTILNGISNSNIPQWYKYRINSLFEKKNNI